MKRYAMSITAGLLILGTAAMAKPQAVGVVRKEYKLTGKSASAVAKCTACHGADKVSLNAYGKSLKATMAKMKVKTLTPAVLKKVDALDADKDKVKNGAELKKGTNPGDPKSK